MSERDMVVPHPHMSTVTGVLFSLRDHWGRHDIDDLLPHWWAYEGHKPYLPYLVQGAVEGNMLTKEHEAEMVATGWVTPEFPQSALGLCAWIRLFRRVGYLHDDENGYPAPDPLPPRGEPVVYRGADEEHRRGMSWTTDRERAEWFTRRYWHNAPGSVYVMRDVPAGKILARFHRRNENEVVIDTRFLMVDRIESQERLQTHGISEA